MGKYYVSKALIIPNLYVKREIAGREGIYLYSRVYPEKIYREDYKKTAKKKAIRYRKATEVEILLYG